MASLVLNILVDGYCIIYANHCIPCVNSASFPNMQYVVKRKCVQFDLEPRHFSKFHRVSEISQILYSHEQSIKKMKGPEEIVAGTMDVVLLFTFTALLLTD